MQLSLWQRPDEGLLSPSGPTAPGPSTRSPHALAPLPEALAARAEHYVQAAHAERTRKAYQGDWNAFARWCAAAQLAARPAAPSTLELYLTHLAELGRRPSTIRRARIAIGLAHGHEGLPRPDHHARIRALERGIGRELGAREEGAPPPYSPTSSPRS